MEENKRSKEIIKVIKKAKGVTMLALVVTIIVLLILAAITLSLAVGENGIIKRAKLARDKAKNASIAEEEAMNLAAGEIDNAGSGGSGSGGTGEGGTCPECPDISELENTIKELQNTIASLEQQLANEKANKAELEKQIADLNKQIADLNAQVNAQKEQIADLEGQLASKNEEIARKDETIKNLESTVTSLNSQIEELNRQIETLKTKQATGNAAVSEVLAGKTFSNSNGVGLVGTMANNGAINANLNAGQSHTIPAGYTTGGRVTANSLASQTVGTATANNLSNGVTAWVNGVKITGNGTDVNNSYNAGAENLKGNMNVSTPTTSKEWGSYTASKDCIFVMNGTATRGSNGSQNSSHEKDTGSQTNITTNGKIKNSSNLQRRADGGNIDFTLTAELKAGNTVYVSGSTWGYQSKNTGGVSWTYIILTF